MKYTDNDFFEIYKNAQTGEEQELPEFTPEEQASWENYLKRAGDAFLILKERLEQVQTAITVDLELEGHVKDWSTLDLILFLEAIEDFWFEDIMRLGILGQPNTAAVFDALKGYIVAA
jgi:hypothetical protein